MQNGLSEGDDRLRSAIARIESADRALAEEMRSVRDKLLAPVGSRHLESLPVAGAASRSLETIVLRTGRPVLAIVKDQARLEFTDAASEVWRTRLTAAADHVRRAAQAVGRIDVVGHTQLQWVGTAWIVAPGIVVTNRHVASEFSRLSGNRFVFRRGASGTMMGASVDFLREMDRDERFVLPVAEVLYIEDEDGPDVALLRIDGVDTGPSRSAIPLARHAGADQQIAVIGYPARDSRIPDQPLMHAIFGEVYDAKRLAPGQVIGVNAEVLQHDCSTLGGNSGSVLIDLSSGAAVGLHFAGRFLEANFAVPAPIVADRVDRVLSRRPRPVKTTTAPPAATPPSARAPHPLSPPASGPAVDTFVEARPADYVDRQGYDPQFLGVPVPLPSVADAADVLTFQWEGTEAHELKYQHFSVVMSRSRRLPFWSAVNIDGRTPHRMKRPSWRLDPRIPKTQQIKEECYGPEPKFSRGHMTRREDPIWGEADAASLGNQDSMHVTNTVPQMQPFNAGIWLGLEDYALEHAREDDMRIAVFTGPFLSDDDPVRFGVKIPRTFWKVIAFIHDDTGALCATGYSMSQEDFLRDEEFVFGQHQTWQTSIHAIEQRAGIRFGELASIDPLADVPEGPPAPLTDFSGIVFQRRR